MLLPNFCAFSCSLALCSRCQSADVMLNNLIMLAPWQPIEKDGSIIKFVLGIALAAAIHWGIKILRLN